MFAVRSRSRKPKESSNNNVQWKNKGNEVQFKTSVGFEKLGGKMKGGGEGIS